MKITATLRTIVLSLLAVAAGTVKPQVITTDYFQKTSRLLGHIPSMQLGWLVNTAKNDPQPEMTQNLVAQLVQDSFSGFDSFNNQTKFKLVKVYNRLLSSPLLREEQKNFLRSTIIPAVATKVANLSQQETVQESNKDAQQLQNILVSSGELAPSTTITPIVQSVVAEVTGAAPTQTAVVGQQPATAQGVVQNLANNQIPVAQATAVVPIATQALATESIVPATNTITESSVQAITANNQLPVAAKAAALTNLINAAPANTPVAPAVSMAVAQAVQDLYNNQQAADLKPIAALLTAATEKPVLTADQRQYVTTTLVPTVNQQLIAAGTAAATTTSSTNLPQQGTVNAVVTNAATGGTPVAGSVLPTSAATSMAQPSALNAPAIQAITNNQQLPVAAKAAALTALIAATPVTVATDPTTASSLAHAVQDLYNNQKPSDAKAMGELLTAATQKPVLTPEQKLYVTNTLMPTAQQLAPQSGAMHIPTVNTTQPSLASSQQPLQPNLISQAHLTTTLEDAIKAHYQQIQDAQGKTFDANTQGAFGASLVEVFNNVLEIQSYMSQLLTAAETSPLLNAAQQKYVRDVMMPGLDQVSEAAPVKSLDSQASKDKKTKKEKKKTSGKKGKKKKKAKKNKKDTQASATETSGTEAKAPAKKKKKKLKKTLQKDEVVADDAKKADNSSSTDASVEKSPAKKKKRKKLKKAKKVTIESANKE